MNRTSSAMAVKFLLLAVVLLLTLPFLTGCANRNPNAPNVPQVNTVRTFDENGTLRADNRGQAAAGAGRVVNNATSPVKDLADKLQPGQFAYGRFSYSRLDAIRINRLAEAEEKYKGANAALENLTKGGAAAFAGDYSAAVRAAADLAGNAWDKYQAAQAELANTPQAGQGSVDTEILISGADSASALTAIASDTSKTIQTGLGRADVSEVKTSTKREDISTEAENLRYYGMVENVASNVTEMIALLALAEKESDNPLKLEPAPTPVPVKPEPVESNVSPEVRANAWYPNVPRGGGNNAAVAAGVGKSFLWKPVSDSNGKAALHTANHHFVTGIEIVGPDGVTIEKHGVSAIGNGYRPLFRLGKAGGGYPAGTRVRHLPSGYTVTIADPAKRTTLNNTPEYGPADKDPEILLPPPDDELINDGPGTNKVTNAWFRATADSLTLSPAFNARVQRVQVVHTRNGYRPAFPVSGVQGAGVENGFQWVNLGKTADGTYRAGKPLTAFPVGKRGPAVWLITGLPGQAGKFPFYADGNAVIDASGAYQGRG